MTDYSSLFRVRTVTCFVTLQPDSFELDDAIKQTIVWRHADRSPMEEAVRLLRAVEKSLTSTGYEVQTVRLATNAFGDWLPVQDKGKTAHSLRALDGWLEKNGIEFCALGPAQSKVEIEEICPLIVQTSPRFSCSAILQATDMDTARACARTVHNIAHTTEPAAFMKDGLGNFRFCVASSCPALIPFFPVAKAPNDQQVNDIGQLSFAIGLENGSLAQHLLAQCQTIRDISTIFRQGMTDAILPIQKIVEKFETDLISFAGIDTSLNPSLDATGSVAAALESLTITGWGGPGTLAVAAALTQSLQSLSGIRRTGYCGIMLPVCEDARLAALSESPTTPLRLVDLLSISSVCGVGIDTVPLPGNAKEESLAALMLDVAGLANRWQKPLSCRVFPVPGKVYGDRTTFNFPHLMNAALLPI